MNQLTSRVSRRAKRVQLANNPPTHIVFAGGVTGGHVFPALTLAEQLRRRAPVRISFLGTNRSRERDWVRHAKINHVSIPSAAIAGSIPRLPTALLKNVQGYFAALRFLRRENVDVVLGLGGYGSAPTARAAVSAGIPLLLLEANAVPGRVTKWLSRRAACVCTAFESAKEAFPTRANVRLTGLPVRPIPKDKLLGLDRQIVVLGGSGGARTINEAVPKALFQVRHLLAGWRIIHQSGAADLATTRRVYARLGLKAEVQPFLDNVPRILGESTLAITRAGGGILSELAAAGLPAVLIPFPCSADDHQKHNALEFSKKTGCFVVEEEEAIDQLRGRVAQAVHTIMTDARHRKTLIHLMSRAARPDAAAGIIDLLLSNGQET